jgi:pimeloyl-ACP methyl ester carboxylesterase
MSDRRRAVTFPNRDGLRLFGILHEPTGERRSDLAIILLSPGVKSRVAPHRMYNKMAARFAALGFTVLRFDFYGLGDSEGEVPEPLLADMYRSIQIGRYAEDTKAAIEWLRSQTGVPRVVLAGLCGGAITGVLAAAGQRDVAGILGLGLPVMLDGARVDKVANMTTGQLKMVRGRALRKMLAPAAWLRLLTFQSDYRLLLRSVLTPLTARWRKAAAVKAPARVAPPAATTDGAGSTAASTAGNTVDNANPFFPPAFDQLLARGGHLLLLFSESDRLYWEFREKFLERHRETFEKRADRVTVQVVKDANHIFTFSEWQQDMLDRCDSWLRQTYPAPATAAHEASVPTL